MPFVEARAAHITSSQPRALQLVGAAVTAAATLEARPSLLEAFLDQPRRTRHGLLQGGLVVSGNRHIQQVPSRGSAAGDPTWSRAAASATLVLKGAHRSSETGEGHQTQRLLTGR